VKKTAQKLLYHEYFHIQKRKNEYINQKSTCEIRKIENRILKDWMEIEGVMEILGKNDAIVKLIEN